ncbi:MAG: hypothetical protein IJ588_10165 [Prevotella sp.]|nr:hypothetical protein [Prevotella sp.]
MRVQQLLMILFVGLCLLTAGIYFMLDLFLVDITAEMVSEKQRFALTSVMILVTLAVIPLSLRLLKFKRVEADIIRRGEVALKWWALLRMLSLFALLILNIVLYYFYAEEPTFGWLAVILVLILPFIIPTKGRCEAELTPQAEETEEPEPETPSESQEA